MSNYIYFWGHQTSRNTVGKECMSQWYPSEFVIDSKMYYNCEQYMMAEKAKLFNDIISFDRILAERDPRDIKALGRKIKNFNSELWDAEKYNIVVRGNLAKFKQEPVLGDYLESTGNKILVEASPYDKVWGVGLRANDPLILNEATWKGENLLGKAIMEVRNILFNGG